MTFSVCSFNAVFHSNWKIFDLIILTLHFRCLFQLSFMDKEELSAKKEHSNLQNHQQIIIILILRHYFLIKLFHIHTQKKYIFFKSRLSNEKHFRTSCWVKTLHVLPTVPSSQFKKPSFSRTLFQGFSS